jgi:hypothetical protein
MYVIVPKVPKYENEKYQIHDRSNQYKDQEDDDVDPEKLIERFPELRNLIFKWVPGLKESVFFIDKNILKEMWNEIVKLGTNIAVGIIDDFESNDDYYYRYQFDQAVAGNYFVKDIDPERLQGILDGEIEPEYDDVDFDEARDNGAYEDYMSYNDTARNLHDSITDLKDIEADAILDWCRKYRDDKDSDEFLTLTVIEMVVAFAVNYDNKKYRYWQSSSIEGLADRITTDIMIIKDITGGRPSQTINHNTKNRPQWHLENLIGEYAVYSRIG